MRDTDSRLRLWAGLLAAVVLLIGTAAQMRPLRAQDIDMPFGAQLVYEQESAPGSYAVPTGPYANGRLPTQQREGRVVEQVWRVSAPGQTTLQLIAPLREQIESAGLRLVFECADVECGGFNFRFQTRVLPAPEMYVNLTDFRFLSALGDEGAAVGILVSRTSAAGFIQLIRVGEIGAIEAAAAPLANPFAEIMAQGPLAEALETTGRYVLGDLEFEPGASSLGEGRYQSLEAVARYLEAQPNRKIAIVGHTDSVGGLDGNIRLSRRRAEAVVNALARDYGVRRDRLEAGGMGYLAPIASNITEEGRAANRRVEAVLTATE